MDINQPISMTGFYGLHFRARERLTDKQDTELPTNWRRKTKGNMYQHPVIIFVCEHGAAKSIIATAYFNKLARDRNLRLTAIARGTHPDTELSPEAVSGLRADGLTPTESVPTKLNVEDLDSAQQVVSFCILPEEYHQKASVEYWDGVPPVSEDYETARDAIVERLKGLLNHI